MEQILGIDPQFPMKQFCAKEVITEYHEYIMQFSQKTLQRNSNNTNNNKKHKKTASKHIFVPLFDVESIMDEKQDSDDDIQVKIRWKGFSKEYDSWTYSEYLNEQSFELLHEFRRKQMALGRRGFTRNYWETLYAEEWKSYMDGHDNGSEHADYVYAFFKKFEMHTSIQHIADFGFGKGNMMNSFIKKFRPKMAYGLEPSMHIFEEYQIKFDKELRRNKSFFNNCHFHLECIDLAQYFKREAMTKKEVKIYNERVKQRKNGKEVPVMAMDVDNGQNDESEDEMSAIMNGIGYKEFCFCARSKNKSFYQRKWQKMEKMNKGKKKKDKKDVINELDLIYDRFQCACLKKFDGAYDLGLCVSVCQYLKDEDVELVLCELAKQCDFLYFDVVTKEEYDIMRNGSQFKDEWAIERSRKWYLQIIFKYWRIISNEILESKYFYPTPDSSNIPNTIYVIDQDTLKGNNQ